MNQHPTWECMYTFTYTTFKNRIAMRQAHRSLYFKPRSRPPVRFRIFRSISLFFCRVLVVSTFLVPLCTKYRHCLFCQGLPLV
ncbi:hypothetical protein BKA70DRAFT_1304455 [Coprinopsis sp. MPI-PUGE-AT-0042]|nr:hypothetical protein BKA70DRAFT_1304455 [Coprinopsis sp. MPI-PUGE-AT-0042]